MPNRDAPGYSTTARLLHWLVAAGIVLQYLLGERAENAADSGQLALQLASLAQHKSVGITVLALAIARVIWRMLSRPPQLPTAYQQSNPVLARLSQVAHSALYGLLFFLPLSGWLMSSASAYSVSWFGLFTLPDLIGPSEAAKETLQSAHHLAARALLVLALVHIGAAIKHWLIDKSGVMGRMASAVSIALFAATLATGVWATWPEATESTAPALTAPAALVAPAAPAAPAAVSPPPQPLQWQIDQDHSHIKFTATQAGAEFTGEWQRFNAQIHFDAAQLEYSRASVSIDATSVATQDSERDSTLAGSDWFDSPNFATVTFTAANFALNSNGTFTATAQLDIRGAAYPVQFDFKVESQGNQRRLEGRAQLDRLALNLGTVEWTDTEWVGQFVEVNVVIVTL